MKQVKAFESALKTKDQELVKKAFIDLVRLQGTSEVRIEGTAFIRPGIYREFEIPLIAYALVKKEWGDLLSHYRSTLESMYKLNKDLVDEKRRPFYDKLFQSIHLIDPRLLEIVPDGDKLRVKVNL